MKHSLMAAAISACVFASVAGQAQAAGLCKLTGVYKDEYGLATATIKGKKGSLAAPNFCADPYSFKISNLTKSGFDVTGKDKLKSCGTFTASLTFMGSCSVFGGTVTIGGQMVSDVFTKQADVAHVAPAARSDLTNGFK